MALLYRMGTGNGSGGDLKPFIVNFTCHSGFIGKTVTMEFQGTPHAGETVDNVSGTVASDGTLTLYPMHDGMWKYYATSDVSGYQEGTITLEKWGNYPVELSDTPNGATVTPTDDVQTWLHCANVWNKSYTTISEVVADTTTLNTLIANENANDYLVRSTTFATDICSNESAMTYIDLNDYCANKLLADSMWREAICNSTYFKKVLNVKVPTMTSDTTPSGVASGDSHTLSSYPAYKAFNGTNTDYLDCWYTQNSTSGWLQYQFSSAVAIAKIWMKNRAGTVGSYSPQTFKLQGSNNGTSWADLGSYVNNNDDAGAETSYIVDSYGTKYTYYRLNISLFHTFSGYNNGAIGQLQLYGRAS